MNPTNADIITASLLQIFRSHGMPKKIHLDNGPPFDSHKFVLFTERYQMGHVTSSPNYSRSNVMVERATLTKR